MKPEAARGIKFVGHSDMNGRGDGVQVMVHRGYAYVGHGFSNGITTLDARDPKNPKVVDFIACAQGTRALHLQTHEDLLLAVNAPSVWTMQVLSEKDYFGGSPADRRILVPRTPQPAGGGTRSPLPLPARKLLVPADEPTFANCKEGRRHISTYDVRDPSNPTVLARFPDPAEADFCAKGGFFGP